MWVGHVAFWLIWLPSGFRTTLAARDYPARRVPTWGAWTRKSSMPSATPDQRSESSLSTVWWVPGSSAYTTEAADAARSFSASSRAISGPTIGSRSPCTIMIGGMSVRGSPTADSAGGAR